MKSLLAISSLIVVSTTLIASAQVGRRTPSRPRVTAPDFSPNTTIFLSGKVVVEDGSPLTEPAMIQTICRGQRRPETHTDSHGSFSFQFGSRASVTSEIGFDADTPMQSTANARNERRDLKDCELQASLAGFTSDVLELGARFSGDQSADVGRIILHRMANVEGFTISATTAEAPSTARKALEKGQEQEKKAHWDDAQKSLEKAVALYPRFAVAWFELGRVQQQKNDLVAARTSFEQSIAADAKYVNPYHGLMELAHHAEHWKELTDISEKLLALNPVSFPEAWFANAIGHYCLQDFASAEKSARRGLQMDTEHRIPRLEYMLGMALLKKPDYREAAQHLQMFLHLSNKPAEIAEARRHLDEIARLSAAATPPASENK
ncbi:MAG: tetratricopeptide repeat protein [Acidobacteria bacterium]|nr:tetratricopeptide repeat protein [Acidobacteriota bacterium]